jgi:uracil-DNA glycosylase family 4
MTLNQLHAEIKSRCQDYSLTPSVISSGLTSSPYAIISAYPGSAEARTGVPFSGGAGGLLWDCLRVEGLTRNDFYITNVIKAVHNHDTEGQTPRHEFDLWCEVLRYELSQLPNLEYILLLGNEALRALTDHSGILQWRGSIVDVHVASERTIRGLASINPALVLRAQRILKGEERGTVPLRSARKIFQFDCHKFKLLTQGRLSNYVITENINPSYSQACDFIDHCADQDGPVALDIETINGETACVGLAVDPYEGTCVNFVTLGDDGRLVPHYSLSEEVEIRRRLQRLMLSERVRLVEQDGSFDTMWLWFKDGLKTRAVWYDTLLAHHTLYPGLPHSLAFLTSRYTTHPYYKDEKDGWRQVGDADRFWRYNVKDACITLAVQAATQSELTKAGLTDFFHNHVMRLQPHLARMNVGGILCDVAYKTHVNSQLEAQLEKHLEDFHRAVIRATGDPEYRPNPLSPAQVGELLFKRLKLVGRGGSTDERNRTRIIAHSRTGEEARAVLNILNDYKDRHKFNSTYVQSQVDPDSRLRCQYKQYGTQKAPGRLSSSQTPWGTGMNLQNQPHEAYPMFVCEPGYSLFYIDLEQAEARVVGWLAKLGKWIDDFERARLNPGTFDCHRSLASEMWGMAYESVPEKDHDAAGRHTLRYVAKRCRHGLNYRMAPQRLSETTGLSLRDATDAYRRYHAINPELRQWWEHLEGEVRKSRRLFNLYGRRWVLTEEISDLTLESIVAFKPQSTIGDKINRVIYLAEDDDDWPKGEARIALNTHDGVVGIGRDSVVDKCLSVLRRHAEEPLHIPDMPPLIIPASLKRTYRGTSWKVTEGKIEFYNDSQGFHRWSELEPLRSVA